MNDQQVNIKLVGEVEKYPVLYNFRLPDYSKKDVTEKAWSEVAKEVNMSVAECKERWKNLRAVFVRNMKPLKSGSGAKPKKAYYLLEAMQFTVPYIKALGVPSGNLPIPPEQEQETEQVEQIDLEDTEESEINLLFQERSLSPMSPPPALPRQPVKGTTEIPPKQSEPSSTTQKKRALKNNAVDKAFIAYLESKKPKTSSSDNTNPETDPKTEGLRMFLLSMLPDLLKMSDTQVRQFKRKALDVIDNILSTCPIVSPQLSFSCECTTPSLCPEILLSSEATNVTEVTDATAVYYEVVNNDLYEHTNNS